MDPTYESYLFCSPLQAVGVLGVGQDITERKKVEIEKANVAQELQTFIDTANAPIFGIDENGLVNEWNNKSVEITGFSREEVFGQNLVKVYITEEFRDQVSMVLTNALGGEETANFEFPLFTKNQQRVEVPPGPSTCFRRFPTAPEPLESIGIAHPDHVNLDQGPYNPNSEPPTLNPNPLPPTLNPLPVTPKTRSPKQVLLNATTRRDVTGRPIGVIGLPRP